MRSLDPERPNENECCVMTLTPKSSMTWNFIARTVTAVNVGDSVYAKQNRLPVQDDR